MFSFDLSLFFCDGYNVGERSAWSGKCNSMWLSSLVAFRSRSFPCHWSKRAALRDFRMTSSFSWTSSFVFVFFTSSTTSRTRRIAANEYHFAQRLRCVCWLRDNAPLGLAVAHSIFWILIAKWRHVYFRLTMVRRTLFSPFNKMNICNLSQTWTYSIMPINCLETFWNHLFFSHFGLNNFKTIG